MSTPGRASLLDRVGSRVPNDGTELVSLEQDLRVLAKLRKDILSGKHPLYKPPVQAPEPDLSTRLEPTRQDPPQNSAGLSLSERIAPNPAVDTQKEEQDFFNSIAQSLPADMSKSMAKRPIEESNAENGLDSSKRPRTDSQDAEARQSPGLDSHHKSHPHSSLQPPQPDARGLVGQPRSPVELELPITRGSTLSQRLPSNDGSQRRERADSRSSNGGYSAKHAVTKPGTSECRLRARYESTTKGVDERKRVDRFAGQRLPPAQQPRSKPAAPVRAEADVSSRTMQKVFGRPGDMTRDPEYYGDERYYDRPAARPRSPDPARYYEPARERPTDDVRPASPPPLRQYEEYQPSRTQARPADPRRNEPPYPTQRYDDYATSYRESQQPPVRARSRSPSRQYASTSDRRDPPYFGAGTGFRPRSLSPVSTRRPRSVSPPYTPTSPMYAPPTYVPSARQVSPDYGRRAGERRAPSPARIVASKALQPGIAPRRDPQRVDMYGSEISMTSADRAKPAVASSYPERGFRDVSNSRYPSATLGQPTETSSYAGARSVPSDSYHSHSQVDPGRRASGTEAGYFTVNARSVKDTRDTRPNGPPVQDGDARYRGTGLYESRHSATSLQDRVGGYVDSRQASTTASAEASAARPSEWTSYNRDTKRQPMPYEKQGREAGRESLRPCSAVSEGTRAYEARGDYDNRRTEPYTAASDADRQYPSRSLEDRRDDRSRLRPPTPPRTARDARESRAEWDRSRMAGFYGSRDLPAAGGDIAGRSNSRVYSNSSTIAGHSRPDDYPVSAR